MTIPDTLLPLSGLRVVALEQYGAGPWATLQLADLGAEVIKIEDPSTDGDVGRHVPPYQQGNDSLFFETFNRNKKSVVLDLRSDEGRKVLEGMIAESDVFFSNLRGDLVERLGLRYEDFRPHNERLVCCSLSGFGNSGPRAAERAYDHTIQALSGWMSVTGEPDGAPTRSGLSLVDFSTGYVAVIGILAALERARRDGIGGDVDVSLFETALSLLTYYSTWAATEGYQPQRQSKSAHPSMVPFQNFRTGDGWITIACPKESLWRKLAPALGRPELAEDPRFATFPERLANRPELVAEVEAALAEGTTAEWVERLAAAGIPVAQINDVQAALKDPQARAREALVTVDHPVLGAVSQVASPIRISGTSPALRRGPGYGEHTAEILAELVGLSATEIDVLAADGVIGVGA